MVENEFKFLVDKNCFYNLLNKLKEDYPSVNIHEQIHINYYYDTDTFDLHKGNITLRVRQTEDSLKLEAKQHLCEGNDYQTSIENSYYIPNIPNDIRATFWPDLGLSPWHNYKLHGTLTTYRTSILQLDRVIIVFDRNFYLGICDYEIEMEFEKEFEYNAKTYAGYLNLFHPNKLGKSTRFFTAKERINRDIAI